MRLVSCVTLPPFDKSWQLLTVHRSHSGIFSCSSLTRSQIRATRSRSCTFYTRDLRLLDCVDQLFDCLLEEVDLSHFDLLILGNPCLNCIKSSLVQLLRFNQHLDPLFLLSLKIFNNSLMINQMLLIFGEILRTDILNLLKLLIILLIDISIISINLFRRSYYIFLKLINLFIKLSSNFFFIFFNFTFELNSCLVELVVGRLLLFL